MVPVQSSHSTHARHEVGGQGGVAAGIGGGAGPPGTPAASASRGENFPTSSSSALHGSAGAMTHRTRSPHLREAYSESGAPRRSAAPEPRAPGGDALQGSRPGHAPKKARNGPGREYSLRRPAWKSGPTSHVPSHLPCPPWRPPDRMGRMVPVQPSHSTHARHEVGGRGGTGAGIGGGAGPPGTPAASASRGENFPTSSSSALHGSAGAMTHRTRSPHLREAYSESGAPRRSAAPEPRAGAPRRSPALREAMPSKARARGTHRRRRGTGRAVNTPSADRPGSPVPPRTSRPTFHARPGGPRQDGPHGTCPAVPLNTRASRGGRTRRDRRGHWRWGGTSGHAGGERVPGRKLPHLLQQRAPRLCRCDDPPDPEPALERGLL